MTSSSVTGAFLGVTQDQWMAQDIGQRHPVERKRIKRRFIKRRSLSIYEAM